jgi:hypothetical protein
MSSFGMPAVSGGAGRLLGRFFALAATLGFVAAVTDIFDQDGAWWHYALALCLWLALLAFALILIPAVVARLLQRIARARNAAQDAVQAGRPVAPFLQRTVDPASGIHLPHVLRMIALAFTTIALILAAAGGVIALSRTIFLERAATIDGVVVEMLPPGAIHGVPQRPRIEFTTPDAVTRTLVSGIKTWPPRYAAGDRVTVSMIRSVRRTPIRTADSICGSCRSFSADWARCS